VESPSFPQPTIVSPSFPQRGKSSIAEAKPDATASERRLERPPMVMSAAVLEATGNGINGKVPMDDGKSKKVSRFLAERM